MRFEKSSASVPFVPGRSGGTNGNNIGGDALGGGEVYLTVGGEAAAGTIYQQTGDQYNSSTKGELIVDTLSRRYSLPTRMPDGAGPSTYSQVTIKNDGFTEVDGDNTLDSNTVNLNVFGTVDSRLCIIDDAGVTYRNTLTISGYTLVRRMIRRQYRPHLT